ncbi:MAG: 5'/3'-nucleotidase SurE [Actinobacteria bacterium]|nr:5'/3'-nucleotidase SurE [Actinomycetota bacterium]MCL6105492.1 5'/3'-nucleotidase SurE [Actinomycetota bacterium]
MRILITNDDGVWSDGIAKLAKDIERLGHDVIVAAPFEDSSGTAAGVGRVHSGGGIHCKPVTIDGLDGIDVYGMDGLPALAVIAGCLGAFGPKPDLVIAGINNGLNVGHAVLHSGTVGAALTATHFGVKSMAVSVEFSFDEPFWDTASAITQEVLPSLIKAPQICVFNLNIPAVPIDKCKGLVSATLAPFGNLKTAVAADGEGTLLFSMEGREVTDLSTDHDINLIKQGYATLSAIRAIVHDDRKEVQEAVADAIIACSFTSQLLDNPESAKELNTTIN